MIEIALNAHLLASQPGYRAAGIHNYLHQLLRHLPDFLPDDWRLTAFVGGANHVAYDGVTLRRAAFDTESPLRRILWEQGVQPFVTRGYDLLHSGAFVAPILPSPTGIVTVYDLTFLRYPQRLTRARRLYLQTFTERTCRRARRILAISHSTKRDLVELLGIDADKIDVTPLGYDQDLYRPLPPETIATFKQKHNLPERFWLFLGTLEPRKNLVTLIEAYARLAPDERLPLILAGGKGWLTEPLFAAIERHNLRDDVRLPGFVPTDDLPLWYNSAELFVFPSVFEGFGLPVLEAMACGTPVITSNVSSLPEVAGDAGLTLPPDDVQAWTDALRQAHDAGWRAERRARGLTLAPSFTWAETARLTVASYRHALDL